MEPISDVRIEGHLTKIYDDTPPELIYDTQDRWEKFWSRIVNTTIIPPQIDFSTRDVYVLCNNINSTSSNYIGLVDYTRDPHTKELYAYCCNVVEIPAGSVLGKCKIVLSVKKKEKLNVVWLDPTPANVLDDTLAALAAKQKYLNDRFALLNSMVSRTQKVNTFSDVRELESQAQQLKKQSEELNQPLRDARIPLKERIAGKLLN